MFLKATITQDNMHASGPREYFMHIYFLLKHKKTKLLNNSEFLQYNLGVIC